MAARVLSRPTAVALTPSLSYRPRTPISRTAFSSKSAQATPQGQCRTISSSPRVAFLSGKALVMKKRGDVPAGQGKARTRMSIAGFPRELIIACAGPLVAGQLSAFFTDIKFYNNLRKPWFAPPAPLFGAVWPLLYVLMGAASFLVWRDGGGIARQAGPLRLYALQLGLNLAWQPLFFGTKKLGWALVDLLALVAAVTATMGAFKPVSPLASTLMRPYLAWVLFAAVLNFAIWRENGAGSGAASTA